jgi:exosortase A
MSIEQEGNKIDMQASKIDKKNILQMLFIIVLLVLLYFHVFLGMINDWMSLPDFSHGFLIPFISLYIAWDQRDIIEKLKIKPAISGLIILLFGVMLFLTGNLANEVFITRCSLLFVLSGIIIYLLGLNYFKVLAFPTIFLIFMIPIPSILWDKVTFPLQLFVSKISYHTVDFLGIPIYIEGNIFHLWNSTLEVAEACSGIRSLVSLFAIGTVISYFTQNVMWKRLFLIIICIPYAILLNVVRLVVTVLLANKYGSDIAEGFSHTMAGILTFIFALLILSITSYYLSHFRNKHNKLGI